MNDLLFEQALGLRSGAAPTRTLYVNLTGVLTPLAVVAPVKPPASPWHSPARADSNARRRGVPQHVWRYSASGTRCLACGLAAARGEATPSSQDVPCVAKRGPLDLRMRRIA